jgi:2-succinyl-5-enolpyruvyl-6-hydroxy-3-cyclohexene-1-carboxylate synthase
MTNVAVAVRVITELLSSGVQEFCLCAGARNSPFVQVFEKNPHIKVFHFFDERSAAFFALGRIGNTRKLWPLLQLLVLLLRKCYRLLLKELILRYH